MYNDSQKFSELKKKSEKDKRLFLEIRRLNIIFFMLTVNNRMILAGLIDMNCDRCDIIGYY